jgi:DNA gyrase inhibitor GyrI
MQLPEACGKVFEIVQKTKLPVRDGFFLENYVNNPDNTPEDALVTEILIPVQ